VSNSRRVSIGLAVYNGEAFLALTLDSLVAQTFEDFELIVCDNASTDRSGEIAQDYALRDRRIRYVRNPVNIGAGGNYRRAFAESRAPYFRWSAADDLYAPESLARCVEVLDRDSAVVLTYPRTKFIDERGAVLREYDDRLHLISARPSERFMLLMERLGYCNALYGLMRAGAMRRTRLTGDYVGSDIVFQAELALYGTFWEIPEHLFFRRLHAAASSSMNDAQIRAFYAPVATPRKSARHWRHMWEHTRSISRAPLPFTERARLAAYLMGMAIGQRSELFAEARGAFHP